MSTILLAYDSLPNHAAEWLHLLQQQAIYESTRAVLAAHGKEGPQLSHHILLAPAHLDVLPILAVAARDYAPFLEPEGTDRPSRAPVSLYSDKSWEFETERAMMARLLHPGWFETPVSLNQIIRRHSAEICIVTGDPHSIAPRLQDLDHRFRRILIFESLVSHRGEMPELPGNVIPIERQVAELIGKNADKIEDPTLRKGVWQTMFTAQEQLNLEPFWPFGLAIEMAIRGQE